MKNKLSENIYGYTWFCGTICIVIVKFEDENKFQAFIKNTSGIDEIEDANSTMGWGNSFPLKEAVSLITNYGNIVKELPDAIKKLN